MRHRVIADDEVAVDEFLARALFNVQFPGRGWDCARPYTQKVFIMKAQRALKDSGFGNATLVKRPSVPLVVPDKEA